MIDPALSNQQIRQLPNIFSHCIQIDLSNISSWKTFCSYRYRYHLTCSDVQMGFQRSF